ncbi:hypothetical protein SAZ11_29510 [Streptomyces sp. FXJ1.4098]|nr:hypothetical protein [Streptomyces sp. FXJ1.4098]
MSRAQPWKTLAPSGRGSGRATAGEKPRATAGEEAGAAAEDEAAEGAPTISVASVADRPIAHPTIFHLIFFLRSI